MKMFFIFILFFSAAFLRVSGEDKTDVSTNRLDELMEDQKVIELKMHKLRIKLIKEDPELKALHKKIMAMHKELAIKIDKNEEMKKLIEISKQICDEILKTKRKRKAKILEEKEDTKKDE